MDPGTRKTVLGDFYYLTTHLAATQREVRRYGKEILILWNEITPRDLYSIMDFTSQMAAFIEAVYGQHGEDWISEIINMSEDPDGTPKGTLRGVQRRLRFLKRSPIFLDSGTSVLDDIFEADASLS